MQLLYKNADNKLKSQFSFNQEMKIHVITNYVYLRTFYTIFSIGRFQPY